MTFGEIAIPLHSPFFFWNSQPMSFYINFFLTAELGASPCFSRLAAIIRSFLLLFILGGGPWTSGTFSSVSHS